jgi:hypothetical protein
MASYLAADILKVIMETEPVFTTQRMSTPRHALPDK